MYVHHYVHYVGIPYNYMYINSISGLQDISTNYTRASLPFKDSFGISRGYIDKHNAGVSTTAMRLSW